MTFPANYVKKTLFMYRKSNNSNTLNKLFEKSNINVFALLPNDKEGMKTLTNIPGIKIIILLDYISSKDTNINIKDHNNILF